MGNTEIPEISIEELSNLVGNGITLIDVRSAEEFEEGHVPGARLLPLDQIEARADEVPRDVEVYLICRSGGRSARALGILAQRGHHCINVAGGTLGWIEAGHHITQGPNES